MADVNILVGDDDKDTCANLSDILGDVGYRVEVAYDGRTALDRGTQRTSAGVARLQTAVHDGA